MNLYEDHKSKERIKKQKIARKQFEKTYKGKQRTQKIEVLKTVLFQIKICEELCCSVSEETIYDWINSGSVAYIERSALSLKLA